MSVQSMPVYLLLQGCVFPEDSYGCGSAWIDVSAYATLQAAMDVIAEPDKWETEGINRWWTVTGERGNAIEWRIELHYVNT